MAVAPDLQQYLVQVALVAGPDSSASQSDRVARTKLGAPLAHRLVADDHAALGDQVLNVAEAELEAKANNQTA